MGRSEGKGLYRIVNSILRIALDDKSNLVGKIVKYSGPNNERLKKGEIVTIEDVLVGNHECFLKIKELPEVICYPFTSRTEGPADVFNSKHFTLVEKRRRKT